MTTVQIPAPAVDQPTACPQPHCKWARYDIFTPARRGTPAELVGSVPCEALVAPFLRAAGLNRTTVHVKPAGGAR